MEQQAQTLPMGWIETALEHVVEILDSQRIPINSDEREKRLANAKQLYPYYGATGQVGHIDDYIFDGEAVLLGEDAAPFLEFGQDKAYIAKGKYWVNNHAHILRGVGGIENKFLCHQLNTVNYRSFVSGTTRLKLTQASLKNLPIKLAPLNEQKRIVDKIETLFSDLDKGEENLRTAQRLLSSYRQSVLKAAVTGELTRDWREANKKTLESGEKLLQRILKTRREQWQGRGKYTEPTAPDTTNLQPLPEGWVWASIGQLSGFITSGSRGWAEYYTKSGALFFRSQNVTKNGLDFDDIAFVTPPDNAEGERTKLRENDLLISITGNPGNVARIPKLDNGAYISQHVGLVRLVMKNIAEFVEIAIRTPITQKYFERVRYGLTKPGLNLTQVAECPIPLPPIAEQQKIFDNIQDVSSRISALEAWCATELTRSNTLRQSILKSAFSGQLVSQDATDEPASELLKRIQAERATGVKTKPAGKRGRPGKKEAA